MDDIGTGLIGAGFMGKYHALAFGTVKGETEPEELQDLMAGGQELADLESSLGGTV